MKRAKDHAHLRRRFLLRALAVSSLGFPPLRSAYAAMTRSSAGIDSARLPLLTALVYALYPHASLAPAVYEEVARALAGKAAADPAARGLLQAGYSALGADSPDGGWLALPLPKRAAVLERHQNEPFFQYVRATAAYLLYTREDVWKALGYGGDAWKFGGYSGEQINDLHWLPDPVPMS